MILIVGNILKDVYLNLDDHTEHFESDKNGTKWLDLSFDTSEHHYFSRNSSFGGAAVSLEVLEKLGLKAAVNSSDFSFDESKKSTPADAYRYILTADDHVSYLTPTIFQRTAFELPAETPDYIYIDRSANLSQETAQKIKNYLDSHPEVGLILHLKKSISPANNLLLPFSNLIFSENPNIPELKSLDLEKIIYLSEDALTYKNITEPISVERIDTLTHLSMFTIAATTVLGGFLLGRTVEESLGLARANVENAKLDTCLTLKELENITAIGSSDPELLAAAYLSAPASVPKELVEKLNPSKNYDKKSLMKLYKSGIRFAEIESETPEKIVKLAKACISAGLVPVIIPVFPSSGNLPITKVAIKAGEILDKLVKSLETENLNPRVLVIKVPKIKATKDYKEPSAESDISVATAEVINRHFSGELKSAVLAF